MNIQEEITLIKKKYKALGFDLWEGSYKEEFVSIINSDYVRINTDFLPQEPHDVLYVYIHQLIYIENSNITMKRDYYKEFTSVDQSTLKYLEEWNKPEFLRFIKIKDSLWEKSYNHFN